MMPLFGAALFSRRFDLGLGNPNTTAALLVMLLVSGWAVFPAVRSWKILAAALSIPLAILLAYTSSRGALVALGAGAVVLAAAWAMRRRPVVDFIWLASVAALCVFIFALTPSAAKRLWKIPRDESMAVRWTVYSKIPEMIVAAPAGWGAGRSAEAYHNWFEPLGDIRRFQHVLSTHGIWLVERGWPIRILYVAAWIFALFWAWPGRRGSLWWSGGCACIVAFGVAGIFSHVGERPIMWAPAAAWLLAITADRFRRRALPSRMTMGIACLTMLGMIAALCGIGWTWRQNPLVTLKNGIVTIKNPRETPSRKIAVIAEPAVVGEWFGQQIRSNLPPQTEITFRWDACGIIGPANSLFLAGRLPDLPDARYASAVWINPSVAIPPNFMTRNRSRLWIYWGQMRSGSAYQWRTAFAETPEHLILLPGCGEFINESWSKFLKAP